MYTDTVSLLTDVIIKRSKAEHSLSSSMAYLYRSSRNKAQVRYALPLRQIPELVR